MVAGVDLLRLFLQVGMKMGWSLQGDLASMED